MTKKDTLGEFEEILLLAVMRLGTSAYGVAIQREIEQCTGRKVSLGAVYPTMDRLEAKGYVSSSMSEPITKRGGRAKRLFTLEPAGLKALQRAREVIDALWSGFESGTRS